jgi:hypothetical protein
MLTDAQIDELEHFIFNSTTQDLPVVLGKALPLLFAELRVVRATLDSKVATFLGEVESHDTGREEGSPPLCQGGEEPARGNEGDEGPTGAGEGEDAPDKVRRGKDGEASVCVAGGDQKTDGGNTKKLDTKASRKAVDRTKRKQPRKARKVSKPDDSVNDDLPELT